MSQYQIPILFLVFNRPNLTNRVFETIKSIKPKNLYIVADGPRNSNEAILTNSVRELVTKINWQCDLKTLFRDENYGCKNSVSNAIDWFFSYEEFGVILEDDILPNQDFFYFMEHCLLKYKNNEKVMMVTGTNYFSDLNYKNPYFFSEHYSIWGWGTWRRSWANYDVEIKKWKNEYDSNYLLNKFKDRYIAKGYENRFNSIINKKIDTWDIQWTFACLVNNGLCIVPSVNLVKNIGIQGTHSNKQTKNHFMKTYIFEKNQYVNNITKLDINYAYDQLLYNLKFKKNKFKELIFLIKKYIKIFIYK